MLTGRALSRRAAIAAAIPPILRLHGGSAKVANLAAEIHQPTRLVRDACLALERERWITIAGDQAGTVRLTAKAEATMDEWEAEMAGALR